MRILNLESDSDSMNGLPELALIRIFNFLPLSEQLGLLPQNLLDELPNLMPSLLNLRTSCYGTKDKTLNFFFISRFRGLQELFVDEEQPSIDLLRKIRNNCKLFREIII